MDKVYDAFMAPLENRWLTKRRAILMAYADGNVLEIGFGTGANLSHYLPEKINLLTVLDVDQHTTVRDSTSLEITHVTGRAEKLPFEDGSFDTVVETLVLCSVSNLEKSVSEIHRVLKPGGKFIFMDHVLPEQNLLATVFKGLNVVWPHIAQGCNLTREPHRVIERQGFSLMDSGDFAKGVFRYGVAEKREENTDLKR